MSILAALVLLGLGMWVGAWGDRMADHLGCRNLGADVVTLPPLVGETIRFVAVGDTGEPNVGQRELAEAIRRTCASLGCDFGLLLGDNFYKSGVRSLDDPQFERTFETPFGGLGMPFYAVLGNHDTHAGGAVFQVLYSLKNPAWRMPNFTYGFGGPFARFVALNTNCAVFALAGARERITREDKRWVVAFGHHPIYSTGRQGNADPVTRWYWRARLARHVDLYLSGHDHQLEHLAAPDGRADYVISGAGSLPKTDPPGSGTAGDGVVSRFRYQALGFTWFQITPRRIEVKFFDVAGRMLHQFAKEKVAPGH